MVNGRSHNLVIAWNIHFYYMENSLICTFFSIRSFDCIVCRSFHTLSRHNFRSHVIRPCYPYKLNELSHYYQLDQSISVLRVVGWYFHFNSNDSRTLCKQTVETLVRRCVLRRLIWVCNVCLCPTKRTLGL